jgi:hypothetical protein
MRLNSLHELLEVTLAPIIKAKSGKFLLNSNFFLG